MQVRDEAADARDARSGDKNAGQDLDRGRFAGAVGPDVADGLAARS
jgi:hypothetical protein